MKQIIIIHGGDCFSSPVEFHEALKNWPVTIEDFRPKDDWKVRLPKALGPGYEVLAPRMPNSHNARYSEWEIWFEKMLPFVKSGAILVGHSLGGIFLTKYLAENQLDKKIAALALVAPPHNQTEGIGDFKLPSSLKGASDQAGSIVIFHSRDDQVVPFSETEAYQRDLPDAKIIALTGRGHFNQPEFPELLEWITSCGAKDRVVS